MPKLKQLRMNEKTSDKPKLILASGDPNGIGPEIILKIFNDKKFISLYDLSVAGSQKVFDFYAKMLKLKTIPDARIIKVKLPAGWKPEPGKVTKASGKFSGDSVKVAAELCMKGEFSAMVTLPLSKEALNLGGYDYPGLTEMLTKLTGSENTVMILHSEKFSVALATGHLPVKDIKKNLTKENLISKIISVNNSLIRDLGKKNPRIALLALNPHAGDNGLLGDEESRIIEPVIEQMNSLGFNIRGPFAADGYFANKTYRKFDMTIAMYHDQGLIPFKMISFETGVNFTAGLKIVRTSPDHGTAFDIAGLGIADITSTVHAIKLALSIRN